MQKRYRIIHTARLILEQNNEILFLAQTLKNGNGFTLPGGKINGEEFAKDALIRETKEEIGIDLKKKQLTLRHVTYKKLASSIEIIFFFYTDILPSAPVIREPEKFKEIKWFLPKDYPAKIPPVLKQTLLRIHDGKNFTEFPKNNKYKLEADKLLNSVVNKTLPEKKKKKPVAKKKPVSASKLLTGETKAALPEKKKKKPVVKKKTVSASKLLMGETKAAVPEKKKKKSVAKKKPVAEKKLSVSELGTVIPIKKKKKPVGKKKAKIKTNQDNLPDSPMSFTI